MIATCGGTTTRLANRPAIIPKFDSVTVAPRSSPSGIERARPVEGRLPRGINIERLRDPMSSAAPPGVVP